MTDVNETVTTAAIADSAAPMVLAEAVSKSFGSNQVLKSISLEVARGEVLCLVGPSGSGKSTFLRCINPLEAVMEAPVLVKGMAKAQAKARALELLDRVGLADRADYYPAHLSGGQQQRVAIARALAMDPKLMLFDELTSALDPELVTDVLDAMRGLAKEGMTMLVVTHEMGFAREVCDRLVFIDGGLIVEEGPPAEFFANAQSERAREFVDKIIHH